jgi:AcrR family transcriptional regulator
MARSIQRTPRLPPEVRRRELLDAALDVITEDGFDALSVEAVSRRAGVTRPVVYDLFGDLEGLTLALLDREEQTALGPMLEIVGGDPGDDVDPEAFLYDGVLAFLRAVHANPRTWRLVLFPPRGRSPELQARIAATRRLIAERVAALLDWGVARRGGPLGLDVALLARVIVATGEDAARLTLVHPRLYPPERLAGLAREGLAVLPAGARPRGGEPPAFLSAVGPPVAPEPLAEPAARLPRAERREHLLDVTLDLLAEQGFDALSIEAIARGAGVNRAIVYRSFPNLQLLLLALLRREDARTRALLDGLLPTDPGGRTVPELLAGTLAAFLEAVVGSPRTYRVVLQRPESAPPILRKLVDRRRADLAKRLQPLVEWGLGSLAAPTAGMDVEVLCRLLLSSGEEMARLALDDPDYPPQRILESTWALLEVIPLR